MRASLRADYMACRRFRGVGKHFEAPPGTGGASARGGDAAPAALGPAGHNAGHSIGAQREAAGPPRALASLEAQRGADRPSVAPALLGAHARLELDSWMVGMYMRDAIGRGGYRAALEYYGSDESKKSGRPRHRFKARGWLLGRLGHYGRMAGWLEEGAEMPDFDLLVSSARSAPRAAYRAPSLWLETPRPVLPREGRLMALEPAAAPCRDTGAVPGCVWAVMLVLDAAGPICSQAGLGAALSLVAAGADRRPAGTPSPGPLYDPRNGVKLHGAPEGCHRWIIADIDFEPRPANEPHYYYDLTDEGIEALAGARASGAPWPKAAEAAAAGLGGMALPDLLENACGLGLGGPMRDLGRMRDDLGRLADAWRAQDNGRPAPPVSAEDQALVDLGLTAKWFETGEAVGSSLDYLLYLTRVVDCTRAVACEAKPSTGAEDAVLRTLVAAIQDMCRRHGRAVAAAASRPGPAPPAHGNSAGRGAHMRRRTRHADATPAMISDLYYCLAEYCRSRRLAADPYTLPLSEALAEDKKTPLIEVLADDSVFHHGRD